jgi:glycosyltransferase domain-containing protein
MLLQVNCQLNISGADNITIQNSSEMVEERIAGYDYILFAASDEKCWEIIDYAPVLLNRKVALYIKDIQEYLRIKDEMWWFVVDAVLLGENGLENQIAEVDKRNYPYIKERFAPFDAALSGEMLSFDRHPDKRNAYQLHCVLHNIENDLSASSETPDDICEIIIPTLNRHEYFQRVISHYRNFSYPVKIIDSSAEQYSFAELPPNIEYIHLPNYDFFEKVNFVLNQSKAKYIMLIADDDCVFESFLRKGVGYLEENDDFSLVTGKWFCFRDDNYIVHELYKSEHFRDCREDDAATRCQNYLSNFFMTFWSLYRKEPLSKIYRILGELDTYFIAMNEIIQAALISYYGKIKFSDNRFLGAREVRVRPRPNVVSAVPVDPKQRQRKVTKGQIYEVFSEEFHEITGSLDAFVFQGFTKLVSDSYNLYYNKLFPT